MLNRIEKAFNSLVDNPHRGAYPKELVDMGLREFCEVFFKPCRIIYHVIENKVIADGRRAMENLLQRRLFQA